MDADLSRLLSHVLFDTHSGVCLVGLGMVVTLTVGPGIGSQWEWIGEGQNKCVQFDLQFTLMDAEEP